MNMRSVVVAIMFICCAEASAAFIDLINLLKTVEETRISCASSISKSGTYTFKSDPRVSQTRCEITLNVPEETFAFVKAAERTCETTSSANISAVCDGTHQEKQFRSGQHYFRFDAAESVTITVHITPIIRLGCNEYQKNLHSLVGATVVFENTEDDPWCMIRLPPAVEIHLLDFESNSKKKCCPDIFVASTDLAENPVAYSESLSACELPAKRPSLSSRCEATFVYFRNSASGDRMTFRVQARHKDFMDECIPEGENLEPEDYKCRPKGKGPKKKKFRKHSMVL